MEYENSELLEKLERAEEVNLMIERDSRRFTTFIDLKEEEI